MTPRARAALRFIETTGLGGLALAVLHAWEGGFAVDWPHVAALVVVAAVRAARENIPTS